MGFYQRALELRGETAENRRYLHANAEVGLELPKARAYVTEKLKEYGLAPEPCGHGITATLGQGGKCILLRADMDALPMGEDSGESFACPTGTEAHTCGHDLHAAMLLTAAKMLKERESELRGTVKFMFQPAEETFEGANDMAAHGILENPRPDAALAFHVAAGNQAPGMFYYNNSGAMMFSVDGFRITIHGKGAHGAYPHYAVDPVNIAVHVYLALQGIIAREVDPQKACIMTVGAFQAGSAPNIIPNEAVLQGTIRCNDQNNRLLMKRRLQEMAEKTAEAYGGRAEIANGARSIARRVQKGELLPEEITEETIADSLYTRGLPEVDLLIRTSGEVRLSNFLLWQLAYAEMVFDDVLWPDFTRERYLHDLNIYASRDRRFGGVTAR